MTERQITAREKELQNYLRVHPRLNLEFKAMMSRLLREHRIDVTPETLSRLTVSLDRSGADVDPDEVNAPLLEDTDEPLKVSEPADIEESPVVYPSNGDQEPDGERTGLEAEDNEESGEVKNVDS